MKTTNTNLARAGDNSFALTTGLTTASEVGPSGRKGYRDYPKTKTETMTMKTNSHFYLNADKLVRNILTWRRSVLGGLRR